jgi:hypothetical protein
MRGLLIIVVVLACGTAHAEDAGASPGIVAVLHNSQQLRLDAMVPVDRDNPRAQRLRESFDMLVRHLRTLPSVELRVVRGEVVAETLQGRVVVANEALADLAEGERLFALAHELGHVMLGHWAQLGLLYQKWVPAAVRQEHTDAVAAQLGAEASGAGPSPRVRSRCLRLARAARARQVGAGRTGGVHAPGRASRHRHPPQYPKTRRCPARG